MADPVIMCAVCRTPVTSWTATDCPKGFHRVFAAYCHGEMDECRIGIRHLADMRDAIRSGQHVEAVAFADRAPQLIGEA
jgi:hypothetical protein